MMIKGVQYQCLVVFFKDYVYTTSVSHDEKGTEGVGGNSPRIMISSNPFDLEVADSSTFTVDCEV